MPEPRYRLAIPIPVRLERADGVTSTEYAPNLSPGGLCVQLREGLGDSEEVRLGFSVPARGLSVDTRPRVVRTHPVKPDAHGALHTETGLSFIDLDEGACQLIHEHVIRPSEQGH